MSHDGSASPSTFGGAITSESPNTSIARCETSRGLTSVTRVPTFVAVVTLVDVRRAESLVARATGTPAVTTVCGCGDLAGCAKQPAIRIVPKIGGASCRERGEDL